MSIFQLGRFWKVKGPGLIIVIPVIQEMVKRRSARDRDGRAHPGRDLARQRVGQGQRGDLLSASSIPEKAVIQVENVFEATSQLAQTTLRSVLGQHELDEMLSERDKLNADIQPSSTADGCLGHQGVERRDQTCGSG